MRRKIVAGNWKMNNSFSQAVDLVKNLTNIEYNNEVELILFPPYIYLSHIVSLLNEKTIKVGVQNCSENDNGAYTGEISASMVSSTGGSHVIIGHSERREYFNEKNSLLTEKVNRALENKLQPIYCCGEHLKERKEGIHFEVIRAQISEGLFHLNQNQISECILAYEPVWAIGTGVTATSDQAQEIHSFIRNLLSEKYDTETANSISILYGGSCKPNNAQELFAQPDIDGGLIGGASLNSSDFIAIANSF